MEQPRKINREQRRCRARWERREGDFLQCRELSPIGGIAALSFEVRVISRSVTGPKLDWLSPQIYGVRRAQSLNPVLDTVHPGDDSPNFGEMFNGSNSGPVNERNSAPVDRSARTESNLASRYFRIS